MSDQGLFLRRCFFSPALTVDFFSQGKRAVISMIGESYSMNVPILSGSDMIFELPRKHLLVVWVCLVFSHATSAVPKTAPFLPLFKSPKFKSPRLYIQVEILGTSGGGRYIEAKK